MIHLPLPEGACRGFLFGSLLSSVWDLSSASTSSALHALVFFWLVDMITLERWTSLGTVNGFLPAWWAR